MNNEVCSERFHKIHRKTSVPEPLFFNHRCFPVNFVKFYRTVSISTRSNIFYYQLYRTDVKQNLQFSRVGIVWVEVFLGRNCLGGSFLERECFLAGVFPVGIVWWESSGSQFSCWEFS